MDKLRWRSCSGQLAAAIRRHRVGMIADSSEAELGTESIQSWFGFGSAVERYLAEHGGEGLKTVRAMQAEWPFFSTMMSNMDMVLAESDLHIATRYVELVQDREVSARIFSDDRRRACPSASLAVACSRRM